MHAMAMRRTTLPVAAGFTCSLILGTFAISSDIVSCGADECENVALMQRQRSETFRGHVAPTRSFTIEDDSFMKDGEPFIIRSGEIHYSRVPRGYWRDRLERVRALGLNTIQCYIFWNFHEEDEGVYRYDDVRDFITFFNLAHELGLLVILRPGPYVCAEWEMGGLPAWLLTREGIALRTYSEPYIQAVDKWWGEVLPMLKPLLYSNGGPIIMVQLENEYGSYGDCARNPDDAKYMYHLYDLATKHLGKGVLYSTVDGGEDGAAYEKVMAAGSPWRSNASVLATVDGGVRARYDDQFEAQKRFNAPGRCPKMWSELWVGWFDFWGFWHHTLSTDLIGLGVKAMANTPGASFSLYMALGGSNRRWAGANMLTVPKVDLGLTYQPDTSSYDYNAPISEDGRHNTGRRGGDLFEAIKEAIASAYGPPAYPEPAPLPLVKYPPIELTEWAPLMDNLDNLVTCRKDVPPGAVFPSFEQLGMSRGIMLYSMQSSLGFPPKRNMYFPYHALRDYVQVLVDGKEVGTAYRSHPTTSNMVNVPFGRSMDLLAENLGRVNYGPNLAENKGLLTTAPIPGNWTASCIPLKEELLPRIRWQQQPLPTISASGRPMFRRGMLRIAGEPQDTMISTRGLSKGYMWLNGRSIGRYWEVKGPQHQIFVPAPYLRSGDNELIIFDFQDRGGRVMLETTTEADWGDWNILEQNATVVHSGDLFPEWLPRSETSANNK